MSKLFASLSGIACFAWVAICSLGLSLHQSEKEEAKLPTASLSIFDSEFNFASDDVFSFHQSDATPVIPADNLMLVESLAIYLAENPNRELELVGIYSPHEVNKTKYPNLGVARAKAIEEVLKGYGAPDEQIVTAASVVQNLYLLNGRLLGGVNFIFSTSETETADSTLTTEVQEVGEVLAKAPPIAKSSEDGIRYFFYNEKDYTLDQANRPFLDSLRRALRKDQRKTVILSGFSQSGEEQNVNDNLAELRAKAVRRYLVDNGLRRRQIVVVSHPGSAKSDDERRVEIKVERD